MSCLSMREAAQKATITHRPEMRSEPRYSCPKLVRMRPVSVPGAVFRLSAVQNVSANAIGLAVTTPLDPGTLLEIELPNRSRTTQFARVVHCTKQEGGWLIGCTLNQTLSASEMERLLS